MKRNSRRPNPRQDKDRPMEDRPVFVQYVTVRRCRNNPSFDRFTDLSHSQRKYLLDRWEKNHPNRRFDW